jgi:beta-glucanase (GH16 family)
MHVSRSVVYLLLALMVGMVIGGVYVAQSDDQTADAQPPATGEWTLIFSDDFDGTALDTRTWSTCYWWEASPGAGCSHPSNQELQWHLPDEVLVEHGTARLRAQRRSVNDYDYTAGMISSEGTFGFQYGYIEIRARLPSGQGFWSAFWTMPDTRDVWPPEIDVLEILGDDPHTVHMSYHWPDGDDEYRKEDQSLTESFRGPDFSADFHTFGVLWDPDVLVWYVDGVERYRATMNIPSHTSYLIANLAVGGVWPDPPDSTTPFPSYYDIDYIKVWQRSGAERFYRWTEER